MLQVYALLDTLNAEWDAEAAKQANVGQADLGSRPASSTLPDSSAELDTDGQDEIVSLQLNAHSSHSRKEPEKVQVRKVRMPRSNQRTPSLKLRRRK